MLSWSMVQCPELRIMIFIQSTNFRYMNMALSAGWISSRTRKAGFSGSSVLEVCTKSGIRTYGREISGMENGTKMVINRDWLPNYDRPCLNQWYKCKLRDDWYKIVKQERVDNQTLYKVVSFRDGENKFFGLTLAQARSVIQIETYKIGVV